MKNNNLCEEKINNCVLEPDEDGCLPNPFYNDPDAFFQALDELPAEFWESLSEDD